MVAPGPVDWSEGPPTMDHWQMAIRTWADAWALPGLPMPEAYRRAPSPAHGRHLVTSRSSKGTLLAWLEIETLPGQSAALRGVAKASAEAMADAALNRAWAEVLGWLRNHDVRRVWSGGGMAHLWPGFPARARSEDAWLQERGFTEAGRTWDMVARDLQAAAWQIPASRDGVTFSLAEAHDASTALEWLTHAFPGRWAVEAQDVLQGRWPGSHLLLGRDGEEVVAFALLHQPGSAWTWRWQGECARPAAMGPLGVAQDRRGRGLGLRLMDAGLSRLREWGAETTVIDWTTLDTFYGHFGFEATWPWTRRVLDLKGASS